MLHRFRLNGRRLRGPDSEAAGGAEPKHAARLALTPRSADVQQALMLLDEHLEAAEWCARRIAATRERALRSFLIAALEAERSMAVEALAAVHALDARFARSLCTLLFAPERSALERAAARVRTALARTRADDAPSRKRYGT